jgi:hypothetical protein
MILAVSLGLVVVGCKKDEAAAETSPTAGVSNERS